MQEALLHVKVKMLDMNKGAHQALADLLWLEQAMEWRPTRLYKLVPLQARLDVYHEAYGYMCGEAVLPGPTTVPRTLQPQPSAEKSTSDSMGAHPIVWRVLFPKDVAASMVSWENPTDKVTNSDLELAGSVIH